MAEPDAISPTTVGALITAVLSGVGTIAAAIRSASTAGDQAASIKLLNEIVEELQLEVAVLGQARGGGSGRAKQQLDALQGQLADALRALRDIESKCEALEGRCRRAEDQRDRDKEDVRSWQGRLEGELRRVLGMLEVLIGRDSGTPSGGGGRHGR